MGGGGGDSYTVEKKKPESEALVGMQNALYSQLLPVANGYNASYQQAQANANQYQSDYQGAISGLQNITETGQLPEGATEGYNNYVSRQLQSSIGDAMNKSNVKGILNSSVTGGAINDSQAQAADSIAKNYSDVLGQISGNYGTLADSSLKAGSQTWEDLIKQYSTANDFWTTMRSGYDSGSGDYDTVVEQGK